MQTIVTDTTRAFWSQTTVLDGSPFLLEFRYNFREACYYMSVSLPDETTLAQGIKVVSNYPLLQAYADDRMPIGEIVAIAFGSDDSPAQLGQMGIGQRVELTYYTGIETRNLGWDTWRRRGA